MKQELERILFQNGAFMYGDEPAQPIENFILIYRRAKKEGPRLKAHDNLV